MINKLLLSKKSGLCSGQIKQNKKKLIINGKMTERLPIKKFRPK